MVTILDSPNNKDCWTCKVIKQRQPPLNISIYGDIFDKEFNVETIVRYCPRCGKEILTENEYREAWVKSHKNDPRLFAIDSEIASPELILAMINENKRYHERIEKESE